MPLNQCWLTRAEGEKVNVCTLEIRVVEAVRERLQKWKDYREGYSINTHGHPYSVPDKVADAIYQARKPTPSINTPDPELDLRVSDEAVQVALGMASAGEEYIFIF